MSFNENVRINTSKVERRGRGKVVGAVGGGGLLMALAVLFISQVTGIDLTPLTQQPATGGYVQHDSQPLDEIDCSTGASANESEECRMIATTDALDVYWDGTVQGYEAPGVILFTDSTMSACGPATADTGPFYCPADTSIYLDTGFFDVLRGQFGAQTGSLAQMYVLAHEWGHHISNLTGYLDQGNRGSGATGGSVRLELQADCFAGAWVGNASKVPEPTTGIPYLKPVSEEQIMDALDAAAAIGDDHIMETSGQAVNPDRFTHGTSEQRQRWFLTGFEEGPAACDTFAVDGRIL